MCIIFLFSTEFNHVHDYGLGIQSDFGGIYMAASRKCEDLPIEEILDKCYTYKHVFNNLIHDVHVYNYGGTLIYTDAARLFFSTQIFNQLALPMLKNSVYVFNILDNLEIFVELDCL